jgi:putative endonuclease
MSMPLPFCVYILFSEKDNFLYIGFTSNLERRFAQHNSGQSKSTACRRPLKLIFCEFYLFEEDARRRENYFKTSMGKKAIKLMLTTTLRRLNYRGSMKELNIFSESSI